MNGDRRRQAVLQDIIEAQRPLSASALAKRYDVSRQIIVGDIALLRAAGHRIDATARGYIIQQDSGHYIRKVAVVHSLESTQQELDLIVSKGATVLDVSVEHPVYGELTGNLNIADHQDVISFMNALQDQEFSLLSALTSGLHLHTLSCANESVFKSVVAALQEAGFLYENN